MHNFTAYNPTKLHFGQGVINGLGETVNKYGKKALIVYGRGSVKRNGAYDTVVNQLKSNGIEVFEYGGIKPNPILDDVIKATDLVRKHEIDVIVPVGGGSVIDSSKVIAVAAVNEGDIWDIMKHRIEVNKTLPLVCVLTLAATGTEMNPAAVVQNHLTKEKHGFVHPILYPKESFLDPVFTATVPYDYTAYGIADIVAHLLEAYFGDGDASLSDKIVGAILREVFEYTPKLMNNLDNVDYRARILWTSTMALNGTTGYGRGFTGDWGVHEMAHNISFLYDTPHGATLSMMFPAWMKYFKPKIEKRLEYLGKLAFEKQMSADETIEKFETFFKSINCPISLKDAEMGDKERDEIFELLSKNKPTGLVFKLEEKDYKGILDLM